MIVGGIDIGSLSSKAVILNDDTIVSWEIIPTGPDSEESAAEVYGKLLNKLGMSREQIEYTVATGYGRVNVSFAQRTITEISCHARGAHWLHPETRTILDMGGQDCKGIKCDAQGKVSKFLMNDKCAAGTGRYLERVASTLELPLEEIGQLSLQWDDEPSAVNSYCAVFAEMDILTLMRRGVPTNSILAGGMESITKRVCLLLERVGVEDRLFISGGVAKNIGVVARVEKHFGVKSITGEEPQMVGALGAALFARDSLLKARG